MAYRARVELRLEPTLMRAAKAAAKAQGVSFNTWMTKAVDDKLMGDALTADRQLMTMVDDIITADKPKQLQALAEIVGEFCTSATVLIGR